MHPIYEKFKIDAFEDGYLYLVHSDSGPYLRQNDIDLKIYPTDVLVYDLKIHDFRELTTMERAAFEKDIKEHFLGFLTHKKEECIYK